MPIIIQDKTFVSKKLNYTKTKGEGGTQGDTVLMNGKVDPNRIDFTQKVNRKETWEIENVKYKMCGMKHPFHIHGTQFKVLSLDGKNPSV